MNIKDIGGLMKQAQALQEKMASMQQESAEQVVTGEAGAGLCKVEMNGQHEVRAVFIDPSLMTEDKAIVEDLVAAAFNAAVRRVASAQQERMQDMAKKLGLPGGLPLGKMTF